MLFAISLLSVGGESLLSRKASKEILLAILNLKILWAAGAVLGIALGIAAGGPPLAWALLVIFVTF